MKTAVVYYSRFGSTAKVARALGKALGAEVHPLELAQRCSILGLMIRTALGKSVRLAPLKLDWQGLDRLVLCAPIWGGLPANPALSFLRASPLKGKVVAILFTCGGGSLAQAKTRVAGILAEQGAQLGPVEAVNTRKARDADLEAKALAFANVLKG